MTMAKIDVPYIQAIVDRHGRRRYYYRRKGFARVTLPGQPGSPEFLSAYTAAGKGQITAKDRAEARVQPRTLNALIMEYYSSAEFRGLRATTQRAYRNNLERFRDKHGHRSVAGLAPDHLEAIFHRMADTPTAAVNLRKRLRRVMRLAVRLGWRKDNPVTETEIDRPRTAGIKPWTEGDIAAYEAKWPSGGRERLALALLLYTGQRRSDVVSMGRQHVSEGRISVVQVKTGHRLRIRIHPALKREIDQHIGMTFLTTQYGGPFTAAGFGNWFRQTAKDAGVDKSAHGLRKAAGRRLAEAGCSAKQIAAILGHASLSEVERYTRDADQSRLADDAMDMLERTKREQAV